jgi:Beta-propeller repeat
VNVDRRGVGTSVVRVRFWAAGLALLAAGCLVLVLGGTVPGRSSRIADGQPQAQLPASPLAVASALPVADSNAKSHARSLFAGLPLTFEPNQGQGNLDASDPRAQFIARGSGYSLFLGSQGAILSLAAHSPSKSAAHQNKVDFLEMKLAGASPSATLAGVDPQPSVSNYFVGHDPARWRRAIPQFGRVRYENVYPGINLLFYGNQGHLEYDFQVAPGSDPSQAELEFNGAKQIELRDGALVIATNNGSVRLEAPSIYQQIDGRRQTVAGSFVLRGATRAGFAIGAYDHSRELVIDPSVAFSTYFGGSGDEHSTSVAVDGAGNIYLAGSTTSPNLPAAAGVFQDTLNGAQNVYIAEITPPLGSNPAILQYVTYLGGSGTDTPVGIGVDAAGDPFVAGTTTSTDFPTSLTAYQTAIETGSTCL